MLKATILLICFLCAVYTISAQYSESDFEHYTVSNGLSDNNVYCIAQDELGCMWIGTEMGLNSFNGTEFKHYFSRSKPLYLAASNISRLIPFSNHQMGVVGREGFQVIDTKNLTTENYRFPDTSFFSNYLNAVYDAKELPDKSVLLSSFPGIYLFDKPDHISFRYDKYRACDGENKRILYGRDIIMLNKNEAIIYTDNNKLDLYDFEKKMLSHVSSSSRELAAFYPNQAHGSFCTKIADNQFIIFNPYADSITFYDHARNIQVVSKPSCLSSREMSWQSNVYIINDSSLAMKCPSTGYYLLHLNKNTGAITCNTAKFLPSYKCNYLFVDNENTLWVGTRTGLLRQKKKSLFAKSTLLFNSKEPGSDARFTSVVRYRDKLYIGSDNRYQGLFIVDTATMQVLKRVTFYGGNNGWSEVLSIQCYLKDTLWLGTTNGLLWFDVNTSHYGSVLDRHGDTVLANAQPELLPVNKKGQAWLFDFMNGKAGFYDTLKRTFTFFTLYTKPALPFARIKYIVYDAYGDVWLSGHGLARWNESKRQFDTMIAVYAGPNKFKDDIIAIAADKKGSLWLYNAENVLLEYKIKEKKFYEHGADEGLPTYVQSMAEEVNDKLWFTTGSQLICYNPSMKQVTHFDQDDGFPEERASSRVINYDPERNCYYSVHNDYLTTFPANFTELPPKNERLLITELAFADTSYYNPSGTLSLDYTQQNFSIHFAVLNYENPGGYSFFYSVDNKSWINLDGQQVIFFNQMTHGKHDIRVKAVSKFGRQLISSIFLKISPPFWKTWWFITLLCVAVVSILYLLYKYRINQIIQMHTMRNNIAIDLHDDIASTMGSINVYSEVAYEKMQKQQPLIAEEILQKIGSASRLMIDRMSDIVWSINSSNDYLVNLVDRMKSYCSMTLTPCNIDFYFSVNDKFMDTSLSMDKRKNIFLIFKECMHNIVKYSDCKKVTIAITLQQNNMMMVIKDDGRGFDVLNNIAYNGNGLKNMKLRARAMNGILHVYSVISKGTIIELKLDI